MACSLRITFAHARPLLRAFGLCAALGLPFALGNMQALAGGAKARIKIEPSGAAAALAEPRAAASKASLSAIRISSSEQHPAMTARRIADTSAGSLGLMRRAPDAGMAGASVGLMRRAPDAASVPPGLTGMHASAGAEPPAAMSARRYAGVLSAAPTRAELAVSPRSVLVRSETVAKPAAEEAAVKMASFVTVRANAAADVHGPVATGAQQRLRK
ncbi:MAG TPA: hypothetical protein VKV77_06355 [Methylovirgula sp.]|nr:hypothetical protein [Methylovirgula sp.]